MPVQVYCHDINTPAPKEYITLSAGSEENYAFIYPQRQKRFPLSARYQCNGVPGSLNYSNAGMTKFDKVRLDVNKMRIIRDDFTFSVSDPFGKQIPFGTAGDCFSMHYGPCRRGHFKVSQTLMLFGCKLIMMVMMLMKNANDDDGNEGDHSATLT